MKKIAIILAFLVLIIFKQGFAQNMNLGVAIKGSTMGLGGDVVFQFHERMDARLGFDYLQYSTQKDFSESDITYLADITAKTGSVTALYDFYILKYIFVAAGFGLNNFNINATGKAINGYPYGDIVIAADKIGDFEFDIAPSMRISPYLGVGFGRALGKDSKLGFGFELGSYYQGSPDLTIVTTGLISPTSNPDHGQEKLFESQISQYYLYPIVKFSLSYKIISF